MKNTGMYIMKKYWSFLINSVLFLVGRWDKRLIIPGPTAVCNRKHTLCSNRSLLKVVNTLTTFL